MRLREVVDAIAKECDLRKCTLDQYYRICEKYGLFLGHEPTCADLTEERVNDFLRSLSAKASTTVANYRLGLIRVWNFAADHDKCQPFIARRIFRPKVSKRLVRAWSISQVKMLLDAASKVRGICKLGCPTAHVLDAMVRVGYDTGFRPSDLRQLEWQSIDSGCISCNQSKTGKLHRAQLAESTLVSLARISQPDRELIFPWSKGGMRRLELVLFASAREIGFLRLRGQGLGTLRKTHATEVYKESGANSAAESLGHRSGTRVLMDHYVAASALKQGSLPPKLA
jgi:integrase